MRCGAFHRVEGTLCLVRHGQAALSGSKTKAPGFAGGYLLRTTAGTLVPGGRLITVDPCYHPEQSAIQRMIVSNDRGMHVRPFERYAVLCSTMFPDPQAAFERAHFPFPYSVCILQMVRRPA